MKIEIWSDVACPFCYIGKRRLEKAIENFEFKDEIEIEWKSFQLNPDLRVEGNKSINQYLAEIKGWTLEYATEMNKNVSAMAQEAGLEYALDKALVANTFMAHRLIQFAKSKSLGDGMEEALFKAYFMQGKNIGEIETLIEIATEIGLNRDEAEAVLRSDEYSEKVELEAYEASQLGIRGVPFFVFDRKYGISGAQPDEVFERTLAQTRNEMASK